eukprot:COSAG02_NODE_43167_length_377_cov_0.935252_1_plen_125_part_11
MLLMRCVLSLVQNSALWLDGTTVHAAPKNETRSTCGGFYGWGYYGHLPCPDPTLEPRWQLSLSTMPKGKVSIDCFSRRLSLSPYLAFPSIPMKMDDSFPSVEQQHLVLLRHDRAGLRWLDARWAA